jgi:DNA-binding transcriptional LysR family regulator
MELRHLRYFLAVAEESSFTKAALKVGIGQPPLSMQIRNLEEEIGVELFRRGSHGVELSEAGHAFMVHARQTLDEAQKAVRAAQQIGRGDAGQLRMGFTTSAAFNPVVSLSIQAFRERYPAVEVSLMEANSAHLFTHLEDGRLDAAFVRPSSLIADSLELRHFPSEPMKIVIPRSHPLASRRALPLSALAQDPFIMFPRSNGVALYDEVIRACRESGFEPMINQQAPQLSSLVNLVAAGLGVSVVPEAIAQIKLDGVRYLDIRGPRPLAKLAFAYARDKSAIVSNFLNMLD